MTSTLDMGIGLRHPHWNDIEHANFEAVSWLEIHSENYFAPFSPQRRQLQRLQEHYQISCHGVGLSLGSADGIKTKHLQQLVDLVNDVQPRFVSEHLSWSQVDGHYHNDLLPIPYTEEALSVFCRNVLQVQDALKRPLLIENPSSYLQTFQSELSEWQFLVEVQKRTDCGLLLDLNNVYVSAFNHGFDSQVYLDAIPAEHVKEIHLAGFTKQNTRENQTIYIDTHNQPVCPEVWQLYQQWTQKHGIFPTLIEWDSDIPELSVLNQEANKAAQIQRQVLTQQVAS